MGISKPSKRICVKTNTYLQSFLFMFLLSKKEQVKRYIRICRRRVTTVFVTCMVSLLLLFPGTLTP